MSNPLYKQVQEKVAASSLARGQFGNDPTDWHEDVLLAERLRSLAVARFFAGCFAALANFGGAIDRARTANMLVTLDEAELSNFGLKRTDLPGFVAGVVQDAQETIKRFEVHRSDRKAA